MKRYQVRKIIEGSKKYYYILDDETLDLVLLPSKYLKFKVTNGRSPKTVGASARALSYYYNYLQEIGVSLEQVAEFPYMEQRQHFVHFLQWIKSGKHLEKPRKTITGNGICNAYLKEVFRFFSYMSQCGYGKTLCILSPRPVVIENSYSANRIFVPKSFDGYLKEKPRNVRIAKEEEIIKALSACTNARDRLLLILLGETGFRIGELLGVDYTRDIDYQAHTIKVCFREDNENGARAKNAEERHSKISDDAFNYLLHYLAEYRGLLQHQTYLFINISGDTAGKALKVESVYDMLRRIEKKTGIRLTPHMLRRYFAVCRWDAGWPLELVSQALGHKHLDTTTKYLSVLDNRLLEASREFYDRYPDTFGAKTLLLEELRR